MPSHYILWMPMDPGTHGYRHSRVHFVWVFFFPIPDALKWPHPILQIFFCNLNYVDSALKPSSFTLTSLRHRSCVLLNPWTYSDRSIFLLGTHFAGSLAACRPLGSPWHCPPTCIGTCLPWAWIVPPLMTISCLFGPSLLTRDAGSSPALTLVVFAEPSFPLNFQTFYSTHLSKPPPEISQSSSKKQRGFSIDGNRGTQHSPTTLPVLWGNAVSEGRNAQTAWVLNKDFISPYYTGNK